MALDTTTTLVTDSTPTEEEDMDYDLDVEEDGGILQFLQVVEDEDCENSTDEISQV